MFTVIASFLSIAFLTVALFAARVPEGGQYQETRGQYNMILLGLDLLLLLLGVAAMIQAVRRRCSWLVVGLIFITPLFHFEGTLVDQYRILLLSAPPVLFVGIAVRERLRRRRVMEVQPPKQQR